MAPRQKPGRSEQSVATPIEFIKAVRNLLRIDDFAIDLAADDDNAIANNYYTEADDALTQNWAGWNGWCWLNPPYANIEPWVRKAYEESQRSASVAVLVPASVGANWWRDWVHRKADVMFLNGRITFVGHEHAYPKDLALLLYTPPRKNVIDLMEYAIWSWKA